MRIRVRRSLQSSRKDNKIREDGRGVKKPKAHSKGKPGESNDRKSFMAG